MKTAREYTDEAGMRCKRTVLDDGLWLLCPHCVEKAIAAAKREAFEEAARVADKRSDELYRFVLPTGARDIRGAAGAQDVALLIRALAEGVKP